MKYEIRMQNLVTALVWLALPMLGQAQFIYTTNSGAITITSYTGSGGAVVVPGTTNGYPVTSIGDYAFALCTGLTSVDIPDSVTSIGNYGFYGCYLTNVTIPSSVISIGNYAFALCPSLTNIIVNASNPAYRSLSGVLFDKAQVTLLQFPGGLGGSYSIPNSVTSVGEGAFFGCGSLTSVTIPDSVTNIGDQAFLICAGLTSVTIPDSVTSIGGYAFYSCSLTTMTIPKSVTNIGNQAFEFCTSLTTVTIPDGVTSIGDFGFYGCGSLTSVTIPNSVTVIGRSAFAYCSSLTSMTIPNNVTNIGQDAFAVCSSLTCAYFLGNTPPDYENAFAGDPAIVYYLAGTTGWGDYFGGVPAMLWNPQANTSGFTGGLFGFNLTGPANAVIVVEASTNLSNPVWLPVASLTFSGGGTSTFSDPSSGNKPSRYYRFRSP